jgi:hypothetical protein
VGALNENMLFYLQSRCIPHAAARRFLTYAFAAEVVAEVALEPVRAELDRLVPPETSPPATIHRAMRYSLFAGGKRIRPILCLEAARAVSDAAPAVERAACALEMVHTYSLIHDDLPALDNDDFRRGHPTCHKAFGEASAILAGDALLTLAFEILADRPPIPAERRMAIIAEVARSAGTMEGMIGGQVVDVVRRGREAVNHRQLATVNVVKACAKRGAGNSPPTRAMSRPAFDGTSVWRLSAGSSAQQNPRDGPTMTSTASESRAGT